MSLRLINSLSNKLAESSKHPDRQTLSLIDRALALLLPFERHRPLTTSTPELQALSSLLNNNSTLLSPYLDIRSTLNNLRS